MHEMLDGKSVCGINGFVGIDICSPQKRCIRPTIRKQHRCIPLAIAASCHIVDNLGIHDIHAAVAIHIASQGVRQYRHRDSSARGNHAIKGLSGKGAHCTFHANRRPISSLECAKRGRRSIILQHS